MSEERNDTNRNYSFFFRFGISLGSISVSIVSHNFRKENVRLSVACTQEACALHEISRRYMLALLSPVKFRRRCAATVGQHDEACYLIFIPVTRFLVVP